MSAVARHTVQPAYWPVLPNRTPKGQRHAALLTSRAELLGKAFAVVARTGLSTRAPEPPLASPRLRERPDGAHDMNRPHIRRHNLEIALAALKTGRRI